MKRLKKLFNRPFKRWDKARIDEEAILLKEFGLKNKRELWRAKTNVRRFRIRARKLFVDDSGKSALFNKLAKMGIFTKDTTIDDILGMNVKDILERRLQTMVYRKNLAKTIDQARQLITHRHIAIDGKIVDIPSYVITVEEENKINYSDGSPLKDSKHPLRQTETKKVEEPKKAVEIKKVKEPKKETPQPVEKKEKIPEGKPVEKKEESPKGKPVEKKEKIPEGKPVEKKEESPESKPIEEKKVESKTETKKPPVKK